MRRPNPARIVITGEPSRRKELARILTEAGHPVRKAGTPGECLQVIGEEVPDVVVIHCRRQNRRASSFAVSFGAILTAQARLFF